MAPFAHISKHTMFCAVFTPVRTWRLLRHPLQDVHDRQKKEAKRELEERSVIARDEAAAAREDADFEVSYR